MCPECLGSGYEKRVRGDNMIFQRELELVNTGE